LRPQSCETGIYSKIAIYSIELLKFGFHLVSK